MHWNVKGERKKKHKEMQIDILTWQGIKRWFEDKYPTKILSQLQITKILNPTKRPRGPSNASTIDLQQIQHSRPDRKRLRTDSFQS